MFERKLLLVGTGYKAVLNNDQLELRVGFSHKVARPIPEGCTIVCDSNTEILISGINKELVTQFAAQVRSIKPPEKYLGTGIRYNDEKVILRGINKR